VSRKENAGRHPGEIPAAQPANFGSPAGLRVRQFTVNCIKKNPNPQKQRFLMKHVSEKSTQFQAHSAQDPAIPDPNFELWYGDDPGRWPPDTLVYMGPLQAAQRYAAVHEWPVFPSGHNKAPLTPNGHHDATTDREQIRRWWAKFPHAFIGVPTGAASGFFVIDIDMKNGKDGEAALRELAAGRPLPKTVEDVTRTGGRHILFRMPPGADVRNSEGKLGVGLDVRGTGGYIVVPPSGLDSYRYRWSPGCSPDETELAEAPGWLLELVVKPPVAERERREQPRYAGTPEREAAVREALEHLDPDLDYGDWVAVGMALHADGLDFEVWDQWSHKGRKYPGAEALRKKWDGFHHGGGTTVGTLFHRAKEAGWAPSAAARPTIGQMFAGVGDDEVADGGDTKPGSAPDPVAEADRLRYIGVPSPTPDMFQGPIAGWSEHIASQSEASQVALFMNFLVFAGTCFGREAGLWLGDDCHHPRLFHLHIGRTNRARKGTAVTPIKRLVSQMERIEQVSTQLAAASGGGLPDSFVPGYHFGGLSSREGLAYAIRDPVTKWNKETEEFEEVDPGVKDKRFFIVESEFANILSQGAREGNTLSAALRDANDGIDIAPLTKNNPTRASEPHIGLVAHITPSELLELLRETAVRNGFLNRFVITWSERTKLVVFPPPTDETMLAKWAGELREAIAWIRKNRPAVKLSSEAKNLYSEAYNSSSTEAQAESALGGIGCGENKDIALGSGSVT